VRLPKGWAQAAIADIADTRLGKMLDAAKNKGRPVRYLGNVNVRWGAFDLSNLQEMRVTPDELDQLSVRDGDIFVCEGGEPGRTAVWRGSAQDLIFQKALHRLRVLDDVQVDYLAHYLRFVVSQQGFADLLTGTTIRHLPQVALQRLGVAVPPSAEQQRIVAKLGTLITSLTRARTELMRGTNLIDRLRLSILRAGVLGKFTDDWRTTATNVVPIEILLRDVQAPQQGRGGREATEKIIPGVGALAVNNPGTVLPHGWKWVSLLRVAKQETGHTPSRSQPAYWDGGVPWIGIRDAGTHHGRYIEETAQKISEAGLANSSARLLPTGTVCLSRTASVGYVTIMGRSMATSQDFATWTCTEALLPEYLMYALMAEGDEIRKFGMGSTHTTIYFPEIRALNIALPPLEEQREIIARIKQALARVDRLEAEAARGRALLDRVESAILAKAFKGKLVPQDPNDEPANVLLDRIRRQRASALKTNGQRRNAVTT
jgi:type I restriction enzyme S subunit